MNIASAVVVSYSLDLTLKCISTLTSSVHGISGLISNIYSQKETMDINKFIKESDLEYDIKLLENIIKEIDIEKNHTNSLAISIHSLKECLCDIEQILDEVQRRYAYNKSLLLFSSFRSLDFKDLFAKLKLEKSTLDNRKNTLFDVIRINNYLIPSKMSEINQHDIIPIC